MTTHPELPLDDPFADWEPGHDWLVPKVPKKEPEESPHWLDPDLNEPEDDTDDICPCSDVDCSQPFGHSERNNP